ncbi:histidine kinase dimerization/phosphoacceptor domain -containing protein [Mucilaginibacter sp. KACC 22773]|uniref:sensor histidine kinase n=1 Tax=Mucilaginibacter sp. KACC 22773 TaxID=3025671 RepID=UPI0023653519|nr:histidine kinase dimerization/phosphoacceptor domain -containing protein [Mucilaginibacter sp. KACC 22773]WDF79029.1 histidine kinase dimerization/phosphoacceptor domain -containing protein [Mucilaginibacter sp. KACC 22773]
MFEFAQNNVLAGVVIISGLVIAYFLVRTFRCRYLNKQRCKAEINRHQLEIDAKDLSILKIEEQLKHLNNEQSRLLSENEWLHNEIDHRVNNNLQATLGLLNLQSVYVSNEDASEAIKNIQRRIYAISLINKKRNGSDGSSAINMKEYIGELVIYLRDVFNVQNAIEFELLTEPIMLDLTRAIPLGLIINEAITNAIKYAFPVTKKGKIMIRLERDQKKNITLIIKDNGVGLPDFFNDNNNTLGKNLIIGLSDQLQGELIMENNFGTQLSIVFKLLNSK